MSASNETFITKIFQGNESKEALLKNMLIDIEHINWGIVNWI